MRRPRRPRPARRRELADRLEHPEARPARRRAGGRGSCRRATASVSRSAPQTSSAASSVQPPREDGEPREQPLLVRRRAGRSSTRSWRAASAGAGRRRGRRGAGRAAAQSRASSCVGAKSVVRRGGQLDRQRQTVEPRAELGSRVVESRNAGPTRARPRDEQLDGVVARRATAPDTRARRRGSGSRLVTSSSSRGQSPSSVGERRRAARAVLEVVEHEQHRLPARPRERPRAAPAARRRRAPARPSAAQRRDRAAARAAPTRRRPGSSSAASAAACSASRVLPVPPGPVSVSSRTSSRPSSPRRSASSRSRPTNGVAGTGRFVR